ncbi:MAG: heme ABC exporter ATP-binding protein CcmA [Bradyrhizobiaceae bacterium]|nr:MAG: heme ABC exporter ATP-binding protein CcmA [Bradyrhizobiaceae bacterium]
MRLTASGLAVVRGFREVFSELSFELAGGELLALTGPNGAGKSSLLRLIAGLVRPSAGALALEGGDPELSIPEQAHYLAHQDAFKPALTVEENLRFWVRFAGADEAALGEALAAVGLGSLADLPAAFLSAGQRRRLSVARLRAVARPLWLLDEPTSALDAAAQDRLAAIMADHLAAGGLIIAATHGPLGLAGTRELRLGQASPETA